ncbi:MAG: Short-chain dehydrogenase/reductase [Klenkia sp.]|nr:Short-chain dehydrogenase/reductase [Klenkia sp.]
MAVVTGASGGVGRAAEEVCAAGGTPLVVPVGVADAPAADRVAAGLGEIDVWVDVACTAVVAPSHELTAEEYARDSGAEGRCTGGQWGRGAQIRASRYHGTVAAVAGAGLLAGVTAPVRRGRS